MEFYTDTLAGVIKKASNAKETFTLQQIASWAFQIAKGLKYLHSLSPPIIHRGMHFLLLKALIVQI